MLDIYLSVWIKMKNLERNMSRFQDLINIRGGVIKMSLLIREVPVLGIIGRILMHFISVDIPRGVIFGKNVTLVHNCYGTVMHELTIIDEGAFIYHNVTLGRKYPYGKFGGIVVGKRAMISAGAKVLAGEETLIIGEGAVVAANAVLTQSIGPYEIWAGIPAKRIGVLDPNDKRFFNNVGK